MSAAPASKSDGAARFRDELAAFWRSLPDKPLFGALLLVWILFFHFLGNSTFGYKKTDSLFTWLKYAYDNSADDQHGWIVPGVVLVLLYLKRHELISLPKAPWWPALALVAGALLLHVGGYLVEQARVSVAAFFVGLYGLTGLTWGRPWLKATFFPFFLFGFCVPVATVSEVITLPLRLVATDLTVSVVHLLGIDVIQQGNLVWAPTGQYEYEVAAACSGIRSLTAIFGMALVYGFVEFRRNWQRLVVLAAAVPLALAGNVLRLTTIIVAAEAFGKEAGQFVHESWWFSLLPYFPPIVGLMWLGHWLQKARPGAAPVLEAKAA